MSYLVLARTYRRTALALTLLVVAGCDDSTSYASLYEPPTSAPTGSLYGTWGVEIQAFEVRWLLAPDHVQIANKCGDLIAGIDVDAEVNDTMIRILEAAEGGGEDCFVRTMVSSTPACSPDPLMPKNACFAHAATSLRFHQTTTVYTEFEKVSDATN